MTTTTCSTWGTRWVPGAAAGSGSDGTVGSVPGMVVVGWRAHGQGGVLDADLEPAGRRSGATVELVRSLLVELHVDLRARGHLHERRLVRSPGDDPRHHPRPLHHPGGADDADL